MNAKKLKFLVVTLCILAMVNAFPVFAGIPTFDTPKVVTDVLKSVSNFAKKVGEKMKDVQNKIMTKFIGKIQEAKEYADKQKAKIDKVAEEARAKAEKKLAGAMKMKEDAEKYKKEAEEYKAQADKFIADKKIYMEYAVAKTQVGSIKGAYDESVTAQEENYSAKVLAVDQNIETIRAEMAVEGITDERKSQLDDSIVQLELSKKNFEEEHRTFLISLADERDVALVPAQAEVSRIEKELKDKGMSLVESEMSQSIDLNDPSAALEKMLNDTFVKEENTETVAKAKKQIKATYSQEKIAAVSDALRYFNDIAKQKEEVSDPDNGISSGVQMSEGFSGAITISNDIKMQQARSFLEYNRQLINSLKLRTSEQMVNSNVNTVNEDQNLSAFSLDDYNYSTQCKGVR